MNWTDLAKTCGKDYAVTRRRGNLEIFQILPGGLFLFVRRVYFTGTPKSDTMKDAARIIGEHRLLRGEREKKASRLRRADSTVGDSLRVTESAGKVSKRVYPDGSPLEEDYNTGAARDA